MNATRKPQYFNLNVFRGNRFVTSYPFTGTLLAAKVESTRLATEIHCGSVVSIEDKSGVIKWVI